MDLTQAQRLERALEQILAREPHEWAGMLDELCAGDPALRADLDAVLQRVDAAQAFLASPPSLAAAALVRELDEPGSGRWEGRRIGPYRVLREVGRGGMARVFLAERADGEFRQRVALKLLRPGLDSELDAHRFRAERQILASLNHPAIARLLDGGVTPEGQPYLALEYIEGRTIDRYCREQALPVRARLELFLAVAEAVQVAHRSLVIHRDLKPSNILVTADGAVKLLDFGLAKLLEPGPDAVQLTLTGQRWMTPEYAAPEQIRGAAVTTLTDVYQLGVVLHEMLAGTVPFARGERALHSLESAVLEEEPPLPSAAAGNAALRGDLDAIVLRALRKEPEARYGSVSAMADDVRRHLAGLPVLARRQTAGYVTQRFVRRHRWRLAALAVGVLLLATHLLTVLLDRAQIRRALDEATLSARKAEEATEFAVGLFEATERGSAVDDPVTTRSLLSRGVAQARELVGQPEIRAQMLDLTGRIHAQLGDAAEARVLLSEALELRRATLGPRHPDVAASLLHLAAAARGASAPGEHVEAVHEAYAIRREHYGDDDVRTAAAQYELAAVLHAAGDREAAARHFEAWGAWVADAPLELTRHRIEQMTNAAQVLQFNGELVSAERVARRTLDLSRALYGERHRRVAGALVLLGGILAEAGRNDEAGPNFEAAVAILRAAYPDGHLELADGARSLGYHYQNVGRWVDAEAAYREAAELYAKIAGKESIGHANALQMAGYMVVRQGDYETGEAVIREALRLWQTQVPAGSLTLSRGRVYLAEALRGQGRIAEAETILLEAYDALARSPRFQPDARRLAAAALTDLYEAAGRSTEASVYRGERGAARTGLTPAAVAPSAAR